MEPQIKSPKKLIEVALPLDEINEASAREKSIRHGHPSTLHLWWARRPLAAARAVIFAQMVNDPGYERSLGRGVNKAQAKIERERLFAIIRKLVQWETSNDESVLAEARKEMWDSWRETCQMNKSHPRASELFNPAALPGFHDPFAGGGALPLEAQRLGLESNASDLNPVAVLINKAMIEISPRFSGQCPVGPRLVEDKQTNIDSDWSGAKGIAEDVRRYGAWMRTQAFQKIGHLYPKVDLPVKSGGGKATVIAWLWARTVKSPNPAYSHVDVPLVSTFIVSSKAGREAWVEPVIDGDSYRFEVRYSKPPESSKGGTTAGKRGGFVCLVSGSPMDYKFIRSEGAAGRMGQKLLAVVAEGPKGRVYMTPTLEIERLALSPKPEWRPETKLHGKCRVNVSNYGFDTYGDLFTDRQVVALTTFSDLVQVAQEKVKKDALKSGMSDDGLRLSDGGMGATAYSEAVGIYLGFGSSRAADAWSGVVTWRNQVDATRNTFARQAIPMTWDFAEVNPFSDSCGNWTGNSTEWVVKSLLHLPQRAIVGKAQQADAATQSISAGKVVSTDPPYYDNIAYADLSDFFYVWLRRALRGTYPDLFSTMAVPKTEELVATPYRHASKKDADAFFLNGMTEAMHRLSQQAHPAFPTTIYYAFKQSDTTDVGTGNSGWETFLEAVLRAGFALTGTWPMSTEKEGRVIGNNANALASSIVLVCRPRDKDAPTVSRREFLRELKEELKEAVDVMIGGAEGVSPVAPVDLAQAVIGPGMGVFSKYSAVLEADGTSMSVHTALMLINRMLTEGGDDFDSDTQFCLGWFDEQGWSAGEFGKADVLARAKGTSVERVKNAGVVKAASGKVRLLKPSEYSNDWAPEDDNNTPVWEALHQMIRELRVQGEAAAGALLAGMPQRADPIRNLAYRLYTLCERKGWAEDARAYNELITSWSGIETASHEKGQYGSQMSIQD